MSTQQDKFTAIADAIRAKKGTTDAIAASNFASEIESIEIGGGESGTSQFYLNKCVLTKDDGYQIERIPIEAGDVIDLGEGADAEASTNWGTYYHAKSHPAMTFQSWASSIEITDNQFVVPDSIYSDFHVGAIYCTSDDLNHFIEFEVGVGYTHRTDSTLNASECESNNQQLTAAWLRSGFTGYDSTFYNCVNLTDFNIPEGTDGSSYNVFEGCVSLTKINLPNSWIYYGSSTLYNCYSLTSVNIPHNCEIYALFNNCYSLTSVNIPEGKTSIMNCFSGCTSLRSVNIPESVTSISSSFSGCTSLRTLILHRTTPPSLNNSTSIPHTTTILVPEESVNTYKSATKWSSYADNIIADTEANRVAFGIW